MVIVHSLHQVLKLSTCQVLWVRGGEAEDKRWGGSGVMYYRHSGFRYIYTHIYTYPHMYSPVSCRGCTKRSTRM